MLARAVLAFLILPGTVAFLVPWLLLGPGARIVDVTGVVVFALGVALLLWCVRDFYVAGKGTLAPWSPPKHLVEVGLYRYSRNPMYVAVLLVLLGWALSYRSRAVAIYGLIVASAFHWRVVLNEEPFLARMHGDAWTRYQTRVPRWFGRRSSAPP
jgi:protein-S-isoprenylcysteine O-methyltransferase Ste14